MKKYVNNQRGFTLVELMIVIVIVGILAAVAVPIYQANVKKAKMSECDAALGTIRTALRVYYAANGNYPTVTDQPVTNVTGLDISVADLTGRYFAASDYTLTSDSASATYTIKCTKDEIFGSGNARTLNHLGKFSGGL